MIRGLELSVSPLPFHLQEGERSWRVNWLPVANDLTSCGISTKTLKDRVQRASRLVSTWRWCTLTPWGQKLPCSGPSQISPYRCLHLAVTFNILCKNSVIWCINWFPEFCEPFLQINQPRRGVMRTFHLYAARGTDMNLHLRWHSEAEADLQDWTQLNLWNLMLSPGR